jgi:CRP-like cAMP-binding protein
MTLPMDISQHLSARHLFEGVGEKVIAELARATTLSHLRRNQPVWQIGDSPSHLYLILYGLIKRTALASNGNERVLDLLTGGDCLGLSELIARQPYGSGAIAAQPTHMLCIEAATVRQVISRVPVIGQRISELLAGRLLQMEEETTVRESRSSSERVLDFLVQCAPQPLPANGETTIRLPASKHLIASRIGLTPETLSRALRELTYAGLIINRSTSILLQNGPINLRAGLLSEQTSDTGVSSERRYTSARAGKTSVPMYSVINIAGRQRMLSQRMAKYWLMLGPSQSRARARRDLLQTIELFDRQHRLLGEITSDGKLLEVRTRLGRLWKSYRTLLERPHASDTARSLFALNEEVLQATDEQTQIYARMSESHSADLVNVAGRQRMLAQRVAKFLLFADQGIHVAESQAGIRAAVSEFDQTLDQLDELAQGKEIRSALLGVRMRWFALQSSIKDSAALTHAARAASISDLAEQVVRQMDGAVLLFERAAESS